MSSNPWKKAPTTACPDHTVKLADIMSEEVIAKEFPDQIIKTEQPILSDYELALKLQEEDDFHYLTDQEKEDQMLAEYMQAIELAEQASKSQPQASDSLVFEKITTKSPYALHDTEPSVNITQPIVNSTAFHEATTLERKVDTLQPENKSYLMKVDPVLNTLATSQSLSEYEGVGDLTGKGLVVQKNVAAPIKAFIQKQEAQQVESKRRK